jgi:aldose 1-epimerase
MSVLPSGDQWTIRAGGYSGTVVSVGGGLRGLTYQGRELLVGYPEDKGAHAGIGQHMFPWPNRITDGKYTFQGVDPHQLDLGITYRLGDEGLTVTATATNIGGSDAPYGYGTHPYLSVGRKIDECELEFTAEKWLEVTPDRLSPIGTAAVAGSQYEFSKARRLQDLDIDNAFTGLPPVWSVTLTDPDSGNRAVLTSDTPWMQLYTGSAIGRAGLAVEPMTCPPDAFISGEDLIVLKPGDDHTTTFRVSC